MNFGETQQCPVRNLQNGSLLPEGVPDHARIIAGIKGSKPFSVKERRLSEVCVRV